MTTELIFEKEYELLQEITYACKGNPKKTRKVLLKAPTFKQAEKLEAALRQLDPITPLINFICDSGLILAKEDQIEITNGVLMDLHVKAYRALAEDYAKFFLISDLLATAPKSVN